MSEQQRARELRATIERDVPETLDLWPAIRRRAETRVSRGAAPMLRRWRPLGPVLAASLLVLALFGAAILRPGQAPAVGAAEIISQAREADGEAGLNYHLTSTYRNPLVGDAFVGEHWQDASGRMFDQFTRTASDGTVIVQGLIDDGQAIWFYTTEGGQTSVQFMPRSKSQSAKERPGPPSLEEWLGAEGDRHCSTVRREADATVAGRSAYVISMASTGACQEKGETGDRSLIWIDQETYLLLGTEHHGPDGTLREQYTVTTIEYGPVAESVFTYTPPAGATVCALEATPGYTLCQGQGRGGPAANGPSLEPSVARAASDAQLATLGLTPEAFKQALSDGQTLADLARERGVDPAQLRAAMLAAGEARIDTLLAEGALTGEDAAAQAGFLVAWLDGQFNEGAPTSNRP